jgi:hypothetical protein
MATYDVSGVWDARQSNGFVATFDLNLRGDQGVFFGTASHSGGSVRGHGEGLITGDDFLFTVTWNNGTTGEYNGRFNAEGRITGNTFDKNHPQNSATWSSSRTFRRL